MTTHPIDDLYGLRFIDRRKKSLSNRIRRFVNNYWLIPVFTLYLELFAILLPPVGSPLDNFVERNLHFVKGPVILYKLASADFPYTLIGHFKEIVLVKKYTFNISQVSPEEILGALENRESTRKIYRRVIESRNYHNTEIGGIVTLVNGPDGPQFRLYEITSMNRLFSEKLHGMGEGSIEEFISFLQREETREILAKVEMDERITENMIRVLSAEKPGKDQKRILIRDYIHTYDVHSEYKYILSPYDFKSFLGSLDMEGEYIGLFHFHNNYMEPPSDIDVANSRTDRQFVFTLSDRGIVIYDIIKGEETLYRGDLIS